MKRILRYDQHGRKQHQLAIPVARQDLLIRTDLINYRKPVHNLRFEVNDWLKQNCSGIYSVLEGRVTVDIIFFEERDATLFWTFHA